MKELFTILITILLCPFLAEGQQKPPSSASQSITIPTSPTQTVSSDVSFQLGQQSGKIDYISKRLETIESDVKAINHDTERLNVYASIAGVLFLVIIAPLAYEGLKRFVFAKTSAVT
jgi:hypothetical protein